MKEHCGHEHRAPNGSSPGPLLALRIGSASMCSEKAVVSGSLLVPVVTQANRRVSQPPQPPGPISPPPPPPSASRLGSLPSRSQSGEW